MARARISSGEEIVDFEMIKFQALDRFLETLERLNKKSKKKSVPESVIDLQYDFLERCDVVLQKTVQPFLSTKRLASICDDEVRERLVSRIDLIDDFGEENGLILDLVSKCVDVLEDLEDACSSWLSVAVLDQKSLAELYSILDIFSLSAESPELNSEPLRVVFVRLIDRSLLLNGEERYRFHVRVEHGGPEDLIKLLVRFLQAHFEYGRLLQAHFLDRYPELLDSVRLGLMAEAEKGLQ